ncbi:CobQ/CobB/MinD/ParA nucleotide binding domain- containing protein [Denitrovibrio acetiphilus DSM 12809]|uniref:CobQ/CobB/MinD/ParA nucleotide binding domain-containing protein n=1 Tax=Denitrovibrio acetiphilus (strain DSM 12809 / NBRC 114555 / N2460) TaxID=522772 RepID=D4H2Z0_DENA2|nr:P-loop NTPase [Denitrovibrio acetiphilus]ADD69013.1 CobQ/CobB/MinD/ParA nucleotide binding domain- containing protein [Denitrovibrio acetiphilus DSM 12809]
MAEILAVASGKGGVGKSFFSSSISMSLKYAGNDTLLVDADLGGANLHDFVGLKVPGLGLYEFLKDKVDIQKVITNSPAGIDFIGGSSDVLGMAHITNFEKLKVLNKLKKLDYKYVLLDLGAGTSFNTVDFFNFADKKIVIMNSEPTAIENSYGFLKVALYRKIELYLRKNPTAADICKRLHTRSMQYPNITSIFKDLSAADPVAAEEVRHIVDEFRVGIILNLIRTRKELNVFYGFESITKKYLGINIEKLGFIPYDISVSESIKLLKPYYLNNMKSDVSKCIDDIRSHIITKL